MFEKDANPGHNGREDIDWEKLNTEYKGKLQQRVSVLLKNYPYLTTVEAKVTALAEIGYNCMKTAIALGRDEHTIHNHRSDIRRKTGVGRKTPFHRIFLPTIEERERERETKIK
jgi:DNA-binding CsgD family transcriptional regulator